MEVLKPKIGVSAATFLVVSVIIGSGVFKKLAPMSQTLGSPLLVILCWVLAGFISLAGALSTAEMVSMFPNSGGEYFYFQKIYGRFFSFMYGWASFTVIKTASISALAYIFSQSLLSLFPSLNSAALIIKLVASLLIIILTLLNYRGATFASKLSTVLTYLMLISIASFIVIGFSSSQGSISNITTASHSLNTPIVEGFSLLKALFVASLGAFWGYEGWNGIAYIGEEIKNPKKNIPLALGIGTFIVMTCYVLLNIVFVYILPIDFFIQLTPNKIAAVEVAGKLSGHIGMILVASLIVLTTLNSTNSTILTSARMMYAMARDKLFFYKAASVHPQYNTPDIALFIQAFWAIVLIFSGSFDQLTDMLVFASFIFYGSTALGVILLRVKHPEYERKYKVIGYPWVPGLFLLFCSSLFVITIINKPYEAFWGLSLIASGFPVYLWLNRK
jgi:APA family basic amino acid/polyamine antiporter